jgi:transposase
MKYVHFVGVDISKETLDYSVLHQGEKILQFKSENSEKGIKTFLKELRKVKGFHINETLICMEDTGVYNKPLTGFLYSQKIDFWVQSAMYIKASIGLVRGKNDAVDAFRIALYAYKNQSDIKLWEPPRKVIEYLKQLYSLRNRLLLAKQKLSVSTKEVSKFIDADIVKEINKSVQKSIKALEKDQIEVEKKMKLLILADERLKNLFKIVTSITGIGEITAIKIIISTNEFIGINCPKKFACYAGVAPFEHSSGSSVRGRNRVSHKANKAVKKLLHLSAMTAIVHDEQIREFYLKKVEKGKPKMLVINAIRNKLIQRIFACVRNNEMYSKNYFSPFFKEKMQEHLVLT